MSVVIYVQRMFGQQKGRRNSDVLVYLASLFSDATILSVPERVKLRLIGPVLQPSRGGTITLVSLSPLLVWCSGIVKEALCACSCTRSKIQIYQLLKSCHSMAVRLGLSLLSILDFLPYFVHQLPGSLRIKRLCSIFKNPLVH